MKPRSVASLLLADIFKQLASLNNLQQVKQSRSLVQAICFDVLRDFYQLEFLLGLLLDKNIKAKDFSIKALIMLGIKQIQNQSLPEYAIVAESVNCCVELKKPWAKALVNACLRKFIKDKNALLQQLAKACTSNLSLKYNHPIWLIEKLQTHYPEQWQNILTYNNLAPNLTLRLNLSLTNRDDYLTTLAQNNIKATINHHAPTAIEILSNVKVEDLPGFSDGIVSVQDAAAQLVAPLLNPQPHETILDAAAAPGGKTCHILELCGEADVTAMDIKPQRVAKIQANLARTNLNAELITADFLEHDFKALKYDKILLDVPCSSTGVIRRHPDIKLLKNNDEIKALNRTQLMMLNKAWNLLKPGGSLVYSTCSVLANENQNMIFDFIAAHNDATLVIDDNMTLGQILPGKSIDGFYLVKLTKS